MKKRPLLGFIGQGWIGRHYADEFESRGFQAVRYSIEPKYSSNKEKISKCDFVFIAVPTPTKNRKFDYSIVESVISLVGDNKVAVIKSTILPGTAAKLQKKYPHKIIIHSPEFLTEATAANDVAHPTRNIIGVSNLDKKSKSIAGKLMSILPKAPFEMVCTFEEAEMAKYAFNTFYFTKVVYMNLLYDLAMSLKCDWENIRKMMSADPWTGAQHTKAVHKNGRGAGGHCLPKDFAALKSLYNSKVKDKNGALILDALEKKNVELLKKSGKDVKMIKDIIGS